MELTDYWKMLRAHWISFIAITVIGAVLGLGWAMLQPKVYSANASGIVSAGVSTDLGTALAGENYAKSRVNSYTDIALSRTVAEAVRDDLNLVATTDELLSSVSVSNPSDTATLKITADADTPENARQLAEAWIQAISQQVEKIENEGASETGGASIVSFHSLDAAQLPTGPSSPNTKLAVGVGGLAGLVVASLYAFLRNIFDRRIRSVSGVESETEQSVVGTIPQVSTIDNGKRLVNTTGGNDRTNKSQGEYAVAEALRELRTNIQFMNIDNPPRTIVVTSAVPGEGKSTVATNLATTIAASGQKIVIIDGDLRRPTVVDTFGLLPGIGLTDVLIGQANLDDVLQPWGPTGNLFVLGAGKIPPNPSELLGSDVFHRLISDIAEYAMVLIDAPPLLPVTDAAILSKRTDGAIIVAKARKTTYDMLKAALTNLERVNAKTLGIILNGVPLKGAQASGYGYGYKNYYARQDSKPSRKKAKSTDVEFDFNSAHEDSFSMSTDLAADSHDSQYVGRRVRKR